MPFEINNWTTLAIITTGVLVLSTFKRTSLVVVSEVFLWKKKHLTSTDSGYLMNTFI
jgi:hypothetical protein